MILIIVSSCDNKPTVPVNLQWRNAPWSEKLSSKYTKLPNGSYSRADEKLCIGTETMDSVRYFFYDNRLKSVIVYYTGLQKGIDSFRIEAPMIYMLRREKDSFLRKHPSLEGTLSVNDHKLESYFSLKYGQPVQFSLPIGSGIYMSLHSYYDSPYYPKYTHIQTWCAGLINTYKQNEEEIIYYGKNGARNKEEYRYYMEMDPNAGTCVYVNSEVYNLEAVYLKNKADIEAKRVIDSTEKSIVIINKRIQDSLRSDFDKTGCPL
jgi:hypothetical protein